MRKKQTHLGINMIIPCISTTLVLVLIGVVALFVAMGGELSRSVKENFTLSLMLDDHITQAQAFALQQYLRAQPYTRTTSYISKEKATQEQAKAMGANPKEFLGQSPIPASFELFLNAPYANTDSLTTVLPVLRANPHIIGIVYPKNLMDTVNHNIQRISIVLLIIAALLMCVSFSLISNTMRMSIYASRFLIHTMKLVGAKWGFIRRPLMYNALCIALISVLLAEVLLAAGISILLDWEPGISAILTWQVLAFTGVAVLSAGLLLTLLSAYISVNRHLRMRGDQVFTC